MMNAVSEAAVEMERLRGVMETGFATVEGRLEVARQRADQAERRIVELEEQVAALERTRWPLPAIGVLTGLLAVVAAVWQVWQAAGR